MAYYKSFKSIHNEYSYRVFNIFKYEIDKTLKKAKKNKLNDLETLLAVDETLQALYIDYAKGIGFILDDKITYKLPYVPLPETVDIMLGDYMQPIISRAENYISERAKEAASSNSVKELLEKAREIQSLLAQVDLSDYSIDQGDILEMKKRSTDE